MIKFVFLDLDETLLDFHRAEAVGLEKTLSDFEVACDEAVKSRFSAINLAQWKRLERGELTRAEVKLRRFELLLEELGVVRDAEAIRVRYEEYLSTGHYFLPGAEALLDALLGKYKLYIASNGTTTVQQGRIKSANIARYFDAIFFSEDMGYVKPQKEFFDACFRTIPDFDPTQAIILGDSLTSDIRGGLNAGIKTCWFNPNGIQNGGTTQPDFEIRTLAEFPELLESL